MIRLAGASLPAGTEMVVAAPDVEDVSSGLPLPGAVLTALCAGAALGDVEGLAGEDGLAGDGVDLGDSVVLGRAFGLLLVQLIAVSELVVALAVSGLVVALAVSGLVVALGDTVADFVADALLLALAVPLTVTLAVLLAVPLTLADALLLAAAGLAGELEAANDGVGEVLAGLGELAAVVGEGEADACGHDEIGVGARCFAAVVWAPVTPPLPSARPPPPAAAAPAELADGWLLSTPDTDEATAWRSGGTDASTMPTTNTAQATAIAGLSSAIRQSRAGRCG